MNTMTLLPDEQKHLDLLLARYPDLYPVIQDIADSYIVFKTAFECGGKLLVAGNGGSAADSEHIVGELMKGFVLPRKVTREFAGTLCSVDHELGTILASKLQGALPAL